MGSDFTIFAKAAGVVSFKRGAKDRLRVSVLPSEK
jgi:ribosomal protein L27